MSVSKGVSQLIKKSDQRYSLYKNKKKTALQTNLTKRFISEIQAVIIFCDNPKKSFLWSYVYVVKIIVMDIFAFSAVDSRKKITATDFC